ncbi:hypothetical protein HOY80DRAFT_498933 [Tuber brumale]|nr:hypothetical protein HOY80DRAFT_498933 [Tuber brumale]
MPRTCLACIEHTRHAQSTLGMLTSVAVLISISIALFAVCRLPFARLFIDCLFPITVSYLPSPGMPLTVHLSVRIPCTVGNSPFAIHYSPFFTGCHSFFTGRRSFPVIGGGKPYNRGGESGNGRDLGGQRNVARQRESVWSCLSLVSLEAGIRGLA